ncbi:MAG: colanic acid biosynthesis glycosyltransferase WcaI [Alphaproteobacteria bacterium]|nr:MAG: colanic acid biosynthesis glycosyltransferase WcaI [Alphaproteobacteria bacterium]
MSQAVEPISADEPSAMVQPDPRPSKRVLIVALNYAPELVGCAKYTSELAEDLVARGHIVEVVTAPPYYPDWRVADGFSGARWMREERNGVTVHRTPLYVPAKPTGMKRVAHLASFGLVAMPTAVGVARRFRPDLVLAVAPTLTAAGAALAAAKACGAKSWLHVQDFEVEAAFDLGLLTNRIVRRVAFAFEASVMRAFDKVSSIAPAMTRKLSAKGVAADRVVELRNWVDVDAVRVFASTHTRYRAELSIPDGHLVALYSGNMAAKQGIEALAEVAQQLHGAEAPVTLVLCGTGSASEPLRAACNDAPNVRFLPLQPLDRLAELLGTADIHLLPQRSEAADLVLPSKLTGMLASGRPVVAMAATGTGLADEVEGCGIAVEPNAAAMTQAILALAAAPDRRLSLGASARLRAEERWRKSAIIDGFEVALAEFGSREFHDDATETTAFRLPTHARPGAETH